MAYPKLGLQMIVFGPKYSADKDGDFMLDTIKAAGFNAVEGGSSDPKAWKAKLAARGMTCAGAHTGLKALLNPKPLIDWAHAAGASDLCNSGFMTWEGRTLEDYRTAIKVLNEAGKTLRKEGIHLHYHNHDFEFQKVDGDKTGMDLLLGGLDLAAVDLCVDVAWVMLGGADPATFLVQHMDAIGYLHLKDHDGQNWAEIGRGKVDWKRVMPAVAQVTKARWAMVEQDRSQREPGESCTISRKFLQQMFNY